MGKPEIKHLEDLEEIAREIGQLIGGVVDAHNAERPDQPDVGFALLTFSLGEGGFLSWISSAERSDIIEALKEFLQRNGAILEWGDETKAMVEEWGETLRQGKDLSHRAQCNLYQLALGRIRRGEVEVLQEKTAWEYAGGGLKECPRCGEVCLEGEEECSRCGLHPVDDVTWREELAQGKEKKSTG